MVKNFSKLFVNLPSILLLAIILVMAWSNSGIICELASKTNLTNLKSFTEEIEENLADDLKQKALFLNLNGAMTRVLGCNYLNGRQLLENGSIASTKEKPDPSRLVDNIKHLQQFLEEDNIGFLASPVAGKMEQYDCETALGYSDNKESFQRLITQLQKDGVNHLDMDRWFRENGWSMENTHFKTDHHWKPEAAFEATKEIMAYYSEHYDGIVYKEASLDMENWNIEVYRDSFLGSGGKRTGACFAGVDDISYIYPNYPTEIFASRMKKDGSMGIHSVETVYDLYYLTNVDYYNLNPYAMYLGGDFPFCYIKNPLAMNDKRIIVIGDSYRLPTECFLSTQFSELYHIDMRHYTYGTFAEFVKQIGPDLVLLQFTDWSDSVHNYGLESWATSFADRELSLRNGWREVCLDETYNKDDFYLLTANLTPGAYEMNLGEICLRRNREILDENYSELVQLALVDLKTNEVQAQRFFIANYDEEQKWMFTVPENEEANYGIRVYNGVYRYTTGNTTTIQNIRLAKYE